MSPSDLGSDRSPDDHRCINLQAAAKRGANGTTTLDRYTASLVTPPARIRRLEDP
jgi:hypothetical protein